MISFSKNLHTLQGEGVFWYEQDHIHAHTDRSLIYEGKDSLHTTGTKSVQTSLFEHVLVKLLPLPRGCRGYEVPASWLKVSV